MGKMANTGIRVDLPIEPLIVSAIELRGCAGAGAGTTPP